MYKKSLIYCLQKIINTWKNEKFIKNTNNNTQNWKVNTKMIGKKLGGKHGWELLNITFTLKQFYSF